MMESGHLRHPSFGLRWEFVPGESLDFARELERMGFSHWSLRLEPFLKYGGPLQSFLDERQKRSQLRFFSDYLPAAPLPEWDEVHSLSALALLGKSAPARLTCRRALPQVPPPQAIVSELLTRLPLTTEVNLMARGAAELDFIEHSGEVSATVRMADWSANWDSLAKSADLVSELEIDPTESSFQAKTAARRVQELLEASRINEPLDITFLLPLHTSEMRAAALRAAEVRDILMVHGWSPK